MKSFLKIKTDKKPDYDINDKMICASVLSKFNLKSSDTLLNVNCGNGWIEQNVLKKYGSYVSGIDKNGLLINESKSKQISDRINFYQSDFYAFSGGSFDYVLFFNYEDYDNIIIDKIAEILEDNGRFIVINTSVKIKVDGINCLFQEKFDVDILFKGDFMLLSGTKI